ncbi:uncharacterized protein LOC127759822 [Oryza glaberrima]|uniref:uncharacterized protein LOC127759822 n=1 Tax=Oryza glaberrima TaxID=4538 RepID=UPI00224BE75F|nr:uncharacterized protein LOC127759822 [Oryza glaberrima]
MDPLKGVEESSLVTKGEMKSLLQDLIATGMMGPRIGGASPEIKLEQMPNEVKLEESQNYLSWSRRTRLMLRAKGVEHYLEETCIEPDDKLSVDWKVWNSTNSTVATWLMTSVAPSIARMVETISNASTVWKTLSKMYSGEDNAMMMVEAQDKVENLKQEGRTVQEYSSELQQLWADLDHYERGTGRRIGTGVRRNGLWYINNEEVGLAAVAGNAEEIILLHCRLGHPSFDNVSKLYPILFNGVNKSRLVCDACEFGKHTRTPYVGSGLRSYEPFILIHYDVWGPWPVTLVSGFKWFVSFIDCYTRMTWIYVLKHKNDVLRCFQDFHKFKSV